VLLGMCVVGSVVASFAGVVGAQHGIQQVPTQWEESVGYVMRLVWAVVQAVVGVWVWVWAMAAMVRGAWMLAGRASWAPSGAISGMNAPWVACPTSVCCARVTSRALA
jgi:hypothetical protein